MTDRQARSLDVLLAEVNKHAPHRSKVSDGGRASAAHHRQNPTSDHEPNAVGVWRAYDFTRDPAGGLPGKDLAERLAALIGKHPAMGAGAYVIWDKMIISFNRHSEGWRTYTGADPHTGHVHLSVATASAGYDSRQPWNLWAKPKAPANTALIDVALTAARAARANRGDGPVGAHLDVAVTALLAAQKAAQ